MLMRGALPLLACTLAAAVIARLEGIVQMATVSKDASSEAMAALWSLKGGKASLAEYLRKSTELMPAVPCVEVRFRNRGAC
jgi:hypothetical protein